MRNLGRAVIVSLALLAGGIGFAGAALAAPREKVVLTAQPHSELDATARTLVAEDLAGSARNNDAPLVLVGQAHLGGPKEHPALFVQLQSERMCGSAGCSTSVYRLKDKKWTLVLDSVGGVIQVDSARHGGMRDLIVTGNDRWIWNGRAYVDTKPAANVDLRPRRK